MIGTGRGEEGARPPARSFQNAIFLQCDNSSLRQVKELAEKVEKILGEKGLPLDVLINNAGCYTSKRPLPKMGLRCSLR